MNLADLPQGTISATPSRTLNRLGIKVLRQRGVRGRRGARSTISRRRG